MMKRRNIELVTITARLPLDVKEWLEKQALQNVTSVNAEMIRAVRICQKAEQRNAAGGGGA